MVYTKNAFQIHIKVYCRVSQLKSTVDCDLPKQLQSWYVSAKLTVKCLSKSLIFKLVMFFFINYMMQRVSSAPLLEDSTRAQNSDISISIDKWVNGQLR